MQRLHFAGTAEYAACFTDPDFWRPYVETVCDRLGLGSRRVIRAGLPGTNAVFLVDGTWAVKLYPDLFGGQASFPAEVELYGLVARAGLPAPALVAHGALFDDDLPWRWPYIVTRVIPGGSLGESQVSDDDRLALARWLGPLVRSIHRLPLEGCISLQPDWDGFAAYLEAQRAGVAARHAGWGMPAHLAAQLDAYIPPVAALIDREAPPAVMHCDLNHDHVLGLEEGGRWRPTGIIDFGDARVGDPAYELGALHLGLFHSDRRLLRAFLDSYGWEIHPGFPRRAMCMALLHECNVLWSVFEDLPHAAEVATLEELEQLVWDVSLESSVLSLQS
ncbi:MAG: hypothetical protein RLZZ387_3139 [Chloroflexota bacterium]|jgi:hygromycin-B 7''-O-kinase